ncbi:hypothetical protein RFZ33_04630, partial [Acinetobacter baumannii]|nr:hypothetical protein [Acinetobacter baumannii]
MIQPELRPLKQEGVRAPEFGTLNEKGTRKLELKPLKSADTKDAEPKNPENLIRVVKEETAAYGSTKPSHGDE